jgi:Ca2+/Na+ antiporter
MKSMLNVKYDLPKFVVISLIFLSLVIYFIATNKVLTGMDMVTLAVLFLLIVLYLVTKKEPAEPENEKN